MRTPFCLRQLVGLLLCFLQPVAASAETLIITAVGDIMLDGSARPVLERKGYALPFSATKTILTGSHITIGNLEAPITHSGTEFTGKRFRFRSPPKTAKALRDAGFTILTLANNHILDYGSVGLAETLSHLNASGISYTGAGADLAAARAPSIIQSQGKRVAFLAYSLTYPAEFYAGESRPGTAPGYASLVTSDIAEARRKADYVIVSFHWGRELSVMPENYQVRAARSAVDAGADVVLGHHPHVLQGVERYRNGVIFYSLGNFVFGSTSHHADRSIIARVTLGNGVRGVEIIPLNVLNREVQYMPSTLTGKDGKRLVERINKLSVKMKARFVENGGRYFMAGFDTGLSITRR